MAYLSCLMSNKSKETKKRLNNFIVKEKLLEKKTKNSNKTNMNQHFLRKIRFFGDFFYLHFLSMQKAILQFVSASRKETPPWRSRIVIEQKGMTFDHDFSYSFPLSLPT